MRRSTWILAAAGLFLMAPEAPLAAQTPDTARMRQQAEAQLGQDMSQADIVEYVQQSGMSRSEMRSRLQMMGYDPSLADRYFDAMQGGGTLGAGTSPEDEEFLQALQDMGVVEPDTVQADSLPPRFSDERLQELEFEFLADSTYRARMQRQDSVALAEAGITDSGLPLFGRALFNRRTTEFAPVTTGPVSENYRLAPGDEVELVLTGDVELGYSLEVNRQGYLVIPDVGQVSVNGITLGQLEDVLYNRLGRVYSGVRRGPEATTRFQVSLGQLRRNQVYVVGEAQTPGAYLVDPMGSAFNALYQSGGPSIDGSFRNVKVRRAGRVVADVDIYDYLIEGEVTQDVRLETGDMVFVPLAGPRVTVMGEVRRPAVYEVEDGEGLRDVLSFAGGFRPQAVVERVQITRILPPDLRRPGVDRVVVDVPVEDLLDTERVIPVQGGDVVQVFAVSDEEREFVQLTGEVNRPGRYEWRPGLTLGNLLRRADGLSESAFRARAHVFRLDEEDGSRSLVRVSLADLDAPEVNLPLAERDSIVVYSQQQLRRPELIEVSGLVKEPGLIPLAQGMSLQDVILAAGGFEHGAYELQAEIARMPDPSVRTDTTAQVIRIPLTDPASDVQGGTGSGSGNGLRVWRPEVEEVELRHGDRIFVRQAPGYEPARIVQLTGEVMFPGTYILESRQERLASVIQRAGGLTSEAYPGGARLIRDDNLVGTNLEDALEDPGSRENVFLEPGDSLHVPDYDPTVLVTGAVAFETRVLYQEGEGIGHYIAQAGGYTENADEDRVTVTYPNGVREVVDEVLWWNLTPPVRPGSVIVVPRKPEAGTFDWGRFLTQSAAIMSATATLIIATERLGN